MKLAPITTARCDAVPFAISVLLSVSVRKLEDLRQIDARDVEPGGLGDGGQEQRAIAP